MRILWIDPIGSDSFAKETLNLLGESKHSSNVVDFISLKSDRPRHLEYHAYEGLVVSDIVNITYQLSSEYDAFIIGCFYDVGLREAREVSGEAIITAPCQSAIYIAGNLGNNFSVLVGRRKWVPKIKENIRLYGQDHALVSICCLDLGVYDFIRSPDQAFESLLHAGRKAVDEDGAEVLILGCTADNHSFRLLQEELNVPVIDATVAPLKYAEMLAENAKRFGWYPSRVWGSEAPPAAEVKDWGLFSESLSHSTKLIRGSDLDIK